MRKRGDLVHVWRLRLAAVWYGSAKQEGQALVEYALILALIAVLTIGVLRALGQNVSAVLNKVSTSMSAVPNP
jgi:pilus assembly protein Flp/PilA